MLILRVSDCANFLLSTTNSSKCQLRIGHYFFRTIAANSTLTLISSLAINCATNWLFQSFTTGAHQWPFSHRNFSAKRSLETLCTWSIDDGLHPRGEDIARINKYIVPSAASLHQRNQLWAGEKKVATPLLPLAIDDLLGRLLHNESITLTVTAVLWPLHCRNFRVPGTSQLNSLLHKQFANSSSLALPLDDKLETGRYWHHFLSPNFSHRSPEQNRFYCVFVAQQT